MSRDSCWTWSIASKGNGEFTLELRKSPAWAESLSHVAAWMLGRTLLSRLGDRILIRLDGQYETVETLEIDTPLAVDLGWDVDEDDG